MGYIRRLRGETDGTELKKRSHILAAVHKCIMRHVAKIRFFYLDLNASALSHL
jgi:hypothetical protein